MTVGHTIVTHHKQQHAPRPTTHHDHDTPRPRQHAYTPHQAPHHSTTATQHHKTITPQHTTHHDTPHHNTTTRTTTPHHNTPRATTPQHHNTTTPQHHARQHHNTTTPQHHNITTSQHHNITPQMDLCSADLATKVVAAVAVVVAAAFVEVQPTRNIRITRPDRSSFITLAASCTLTSIAFVVVAAARHATRSDPSRDKRRRRWCYCDGARHCERVEARRDKLAAVPELCFLCSSRTLLDSDASR